MNSQGPTGVIFGECLVDDFGDSQRLGGAPFNVAQHLQGLGTTALFISQVGDDVRGRCIQAHMQQWQMPLNGLSVSTHLPTGRVEVCADPVLGHQFHILPHQAYDAIPLPETLPEPIAWLYHGSLALREQGESLQNWSILAALSPWRFMDINLRSPWWQPESLGTWMTGASVLKCNEDELDSLLETYALPTGPDLQDKMQVFTERFSLGALLLTCGAEGAAYWDRKNFYRVAATFVAALKNTVGAGDAFAAAWLWNYWRGASPENCLLRGGELAAAICSLPGATPDTRGFYDPFRRRWTQAES
ncbi:PfkB family carbohydrate kinase [Acidithiobacillus montserratensis]|uniref:PfkB family carbohydrate kinase n=1 Tax=Acidithiobacillus montserratensis TaxID=2729135 RepID=A0ACD5HIU7_9PROT|nr:PfkB family carbohydrate kinase [Acidithiobacillus montserratensis]MBN2679578.1 carbohydrate kinase [Acidithiobacillaceae bacterium]MBU2749315.1 carbohydrate kinase [Acidithiobacillus montserratensis]